jgi:hypothetical protein
MPVTSEYKSVPVVVKVLWELLIAYGKQETIDPLKRLGRFVGLGLPAMWLLGIGLSLLLLGGLRVLQTETGTHFTGNWSWAPYLIVAAVALALLVLTGLVAFKEKIFKKKGSGA